MATLQEICVLWLKSKSPDVKESTFTRYVRIVEKYILPSFETQQLAKIDAIIINKAFDLLKNRLSDKTVSDIRCVFKSIWSFGIKNNYPCCDFQFPKSRIKTTHHQPNNRIQKGGKRLPSFLYLKNRFDVYGQKMTLFRNPDGLPLELHE